jgi:BolA protein
MTKINSGRQRIKYRENNMTIEAVIQEKLLSAFSPIHLDVINESHQHNVAPGSESHFKVIIVSEDFEGERLIKRHRAINSLLATELAEKIHALALHTYTETEWQNYYADNTPLSPNCLGGGKKAG